MTSFIGRMLPGKYLAGLVFQLLSVVDTMMETGTRCAGTDSPGCRQGVQRSGECIMIALG